jgi:hypothetical protein
MMIRNHFHFFAGLIQDSQISVACHYLPCYRWVLENRLADELHSLAEPCETGTVVLLDYETNAAVNDLSRPLSHASLVIAFLAYRERPGLSP